MLIWVYQSNKQVFKMEDLSHVMASYWQYTRVDDRGIKFLLKPSFKAS